MTVRIFAFASLTLLATIAIGGVQQATEVAPDWILPQWGPGIAALAMLALFRHDAHRFSLFVRTIPPSRYALAAAVPFVAAVAVAAVLNTSGTSNARRANFDGVSWVLLLWMPIGALGEELGWRGYLHKRLDGAVPPWASCLIVAGLWAPWHVGLYANGPLYMAFFLLTVVGFTVVLYALVADIGFNILVAVIFHLAINIANAWSLDIINDVRFMVANSLVWTVLAVVFVVVRRSAFIRFARP